MHIVKPSLKGLDLLRMVTKFSCGGPNNPCPCWITAVVFDENFFTGPRVNLVRNWLVEEFEPSGLGAKLVMGLYRKYGQRVAKVVEKNSILKLFNKVLAKAEAKGTFTLPVNCDAGSRILRREAIMNRPSRLLKSNRHPALFLNRKAVAACLLQDPVNVVFHGLRREV